MRRRRDVTVDFGGDRNRIASQVRALLDMVNMLEKEDEGEEKVLEKIRAYAAESCKLKRIKYRSFLTKFLRIKEGGVNGNEQSEIISLLEKIRKTNFEDFIEAVRELRRKGKMRSYSKILFFLSERRTLTEEVMDKDVVTDEQAAGEIYKM